MKKSLLFIGLFLIAQSLFAQWTTSGTSIYYNSGPVGIGTSGPGSNTKLEVNGITRVTSATGTATNYLQVGAITSSENFGYISSAGQINGTGLKFQTTSGANANFGVNRMVITNNGNVGIGTETPGSFMLAVEGSLGARSVQVTLTTPWPDFVFKSDYHLPSLDSLSRYIQQNQHLPGIPAAPEVIKNGLDLGQSQAALLKKIEELTLYLLEQNTQAENQSRLIVEQNKKLQELDKQLTEQARVQQEHVRVQQEEDRELQALTERLSRLERLLSTATSAR